MGLYPRPQSGHRRCPTAFSATDDHRRIRPGPPWPRDREEPLEPALLSAIDRLTPEQREVVLLRFVADLPIEAVARITRRTTGAVKSLQHRALAQLAGTVSSEARQTL